MRGRRRRGQARAGSRRAGHWKREHVVWAFSFSKFEPFCSTSRPRLGDRPHGILVEVQHLRYRFRLLRTSSLYFPFSFPTHQMPRGQTDVRKSATDADANICSLTTSRCNCASAGVSSHPHNGAISAVHTLLDETPPL